MSTLGLTTEGILSPGVGAEVPGVLETGLCDLADKPNALLLFPDPLLYDGALASASSEDGPRVGPAEPEATNLGLLLPEVLGAPDDDSSTAVDLVLSRGGGVGAAEWLYRAHEGAAMDAWEGYSHEVLLWGHHGPVTGNQLGAVVLWSRVYRRVLVLTAQDDGTVKITYAPATARPSTATDWSSTTFTPTNGLSDSGHALAACELYDGTLLLAVRRAVLGSDGHVSESGDWDLYRSTDGLTWRLVHELLFQRLGFSFTPERKTCARMASSGGWVRLCVVDDTGSILVAVSSDGGHAWAAGTSLVGTVDIAGLQTAQLNDKLPFDLVGVDDSTGTFLLTAVPAGGVVQVSTWVAQRDQAFAEVDLLGSVGDLPATVRSMAWLRDPYWLWLWVACGGSGSGDDRWEAWRVPRDEAQTASSWERIDNPLRSRGAIRNVPMQLRATWLGDRGVLVGYQHDTEGASPWQRSLERPWLCWVGGWSELPAATDYTLADDIAEAVNWTALYGEPGGGASSSTQSQWTSQLSAGGTHSWTGNAIRFVSTGIGDVAKQRIDIDPADPDAPTQWDAPSADEPAWQQQRRWVAEWVVATGQTNSTIATDDNAAMRVVMPAAQAGGVGWQLAVRILTASVVLYDEAGATPLLTLSTSTINEGETDRMTRVRLVVSPAASPSQPTAALHARRDDGDAWDVAGPVTLPGYSATALTQIRLEIGNIGYNGLGGPLVSWWREFRVFGQRFRVDYARSWNQTDLPGARAAVRARALGSGSTYTDPSAYLVGWAGGGGARGDQWASTLGHSGAAELALVDSPRVPWRSAVGATAGAWVQFDACGGAAEDDGRRFHHNGAAVYGTDAEDVGVWYASDEDFTSGVSVAVTLSTRIAADVRIGARSGRVLALSGGATLAPNGGLAGRLLRVTAASGPGGVGTVHRIERDWWDGATRYVALATGGQWAASLVSAGDTVSVLSGSALATYGTVVARRYLRYVFGAAGENSWDGRWRAGTVVPGHAVSLGGLLDWSHSDEERGGRSVVRTRGGQSWAYQESEPYRVVTGRLVGDVNGERQGLRELLRVLAGYEERPLGLLLSEEATADQERHLLLARWVGPTVQDQQAWTRMSGDGILRPAGDMQVSFEEIV